MTLERRAAAAADGGGGAYSTSLSSLVPPPQLSEGGGGGGGGGSMPTTLADALEVEVALRTLTALRIEESVLVALADRRRALAARTLAGVPTPYEQTVRAFGASGAAGDVWIKLSPAEEAEARPFTCTLVCICYLRSKLSCPALLSLNCLSLTRLDVLCSLKPPYVIHSTRYLEDAES